MAALGQGTLVAGRYQLIEPLTSDVAGIEKWLANDQVLEREVFVFTFNSGRQAAALDSARRASLVHDERLVRVVDAGEFEDVPYMITAKPRGKTLFDIVTDHSPLSSDQARAIIGEASEALESARRRGVNHLVLRPSNIYRLESGEIVISGLGYEGALLGLDTAAPLVTARTDAMGLVANLYFALTGRWPGTLPPGVDSSRLEQAPVVSGSPVAPTELTSGIPNDLDTLCAVTFGPNHDGPHSASDLARDLEPWGEISTEDHLIMSDEAAPQPENTPQPPAPPQPQRQSFRNRVEPRTPPGTPTGAAAAGGVVGAAAASGAPRTVPPAQGATRPILPGQGGNANPRGSSGPHTGATPSASGAPRRVNALPLTGQTHRPPQGAFLRGEHPPSQRPVGAAAMGAAGAGGANDGGGGQGKGSVNLTPFIFGVVGLLVLIGVVLAFNTLKGSSGAEDQMAQQTPTPEVPAPDPSDDESEEPEPEESDEEEEEEEEAKPAFIDSVEALDPDGDGEHPEDQHKAIDGESDTAWSSRWYNEPEMPGKSGIGLAVTLEEKSEISSVEIATNGEGGNIEIRNTDNEDPSGGKLLDSGSVDGTTTFDFDAVETDTFVIWVTELPVDPEGENRIAISDIVVS